MMEKKSTWVFMSLFFMLLSVSCAKKVQKETEVYSNDFESGDLTGITNGILESYNKTTVLGRYNAGGFELQVSNLPQHDLVRIAFDLYIHDSWDGNEIGGEGPDIWEMKVDEEVFIKTTFSNVKCPNTTFCPPQSFPSNYLNSNNNPRKGANKIDLPNACNPSGTSSLYKIMKTFRHSDNKLFIQCIDRLIAGDGILDPKCEESWSVDNINISVIALE